MRAHTRHIRRQDWHASPIPVTLIGLHRHSNPKVGVRTQTHQPCGWRLYRIQLAPWQRYPPRQSPGVDLTMIACIPPLRPGADNTSGRGLYDKQACRTIRTRWIAGALTPKRTTLAAKVRINTRHRAPEPKPRCSRPVLNRLAAHQGTELRSHPQANLRAEAWGAALVLWDWLHRAEDSPGVTCTRLGHGPERIRTLCRQWALRTKSDGSKTGPGAASRTTGCDTGLEIIPKDTPVCNLLNTVH